MRYIEETGSESSFKILLSLKFHILLLKFIFQRKVDSGLYYLSVCANSGG